jgi:hypothetical protein
MTFERSTLRQNRTGAAAAAATSGRSQLKYADSGTARDSVVLPTRRTPASQQTGARRQLSATLDCHTGR